MINIKDIIIDNITYSIILSDVGDDVYKEYYYFIFKMNGVNCDNWNDVDIDILNQLCQEAVDYILLNLPNNFSFYTTNETLYNIYKSYEFNFIEFYFCREKSIVYPIPFKISFYDKI
jgi:hypothetical protein